MSFVATRAVGALVDRLGSARVGTFGVLFTTVVTYVGFVLVPPPIPVMAIFIGLMLGMAFRNVAYNTLASKVPHANERARFTSVQSAVQHLASALGAFASSEMLGEGPGGTLEGVATIAYVSIAVGSVLVPLLFVVERRLLAR